MLLKARLLFQRVRQRLNSELAAAVVAYPQHAVSFQIVVQHRLNPQCTVMQLAGRQHGAGTAPVIAEFQLQLIARCGRCAPVPASQYSARLLAPRYLARATIS